MFQQKGISLIELIVFILVMGLIVTTILIGMDRVLTGVGIPRAVETASQLSLARMDIILAARESTGFESLVDPCSSAAPPEVCTALSQFAQTEGININTTIANDGSNYKLITVAASGKASATLQSRVAHYEAPQNP